MENKVCAFYNRIHQLQCTVQFFYEFESKMENLLTCSRGYPKPECYGLRDVVKHIARIDDVVLPIDVDDFLSVGLGQVRVNLSSDRGRSCKTQK